MDIFNAVKSGDMPRVIYLVEEQQAELQQHDAWDGTPLYYASFTGNQEMVKYLLSRGAVCERRTFDGERCLYAALNDDTRNLLLYQGFKRAGANRHDLYLDFIGKLTGALESFSDICFCFPWGESIDAHRFFLTARCPALGKMIDKVWSRDRVAQVEGKFCDPWALQAVVRWCYTARLEISPGHRLACLGFLHDLGLQELEGKLSMEGLQGEFPLVVAPSIDEAKAAMQEAMSRTAEAGFSGRDTGAELHFDATIVVRPQQEAGSKRFRAHKAVLCLRSDYFRILLTNADFKEGRYNNKILSEGSLLESRAQELQVGFADPEVVATALIWMYTDHLPKDLPSDHLLEALSISVALMCEGLKQKCALLLQPHVTVGTAIPFLAEAMSLEADRLADACLYVIAQNLKSLVGQPEFAELVQASATSVAKRQDVDSVPIVDDIRYFITQIHGEDAAENEAYWDEDGNIVCSGGEEDFQLLSEKNQKLFLLQELLASLGLEA